MSFPNNNQDRPRDRRRSELFSTAAAELGLEPVPGLTQFQEALDMFQSLKFNRLQKQKIFSCWRHPGRPGYFLFDLGLVSDHGGWQWTGVLDGTRFPTAPDFEITGKNFFDRLGGFLKKRPTSKLPAPAGFHDTYLLEGDPSQLASFLTPNRLGQIQALPMPKVGTVEMANGRLLYHQSLNHRADNPTDFDARNATAEDIREIVAEGLTIFSICR